jgi:hypothetical protein
LPFVYKSVAPQIMHLCTCQDQQTMMKEMDLKEITNARIASRLKQVLVLVAIILIGIMISIATQA